MLAPPSSYGKIPELRAQKEGYSLDISILEIFKNRPT